MKRVLLLILTACILVFTACGYIPKELTAEQSEENVAKYMQAFSETAAEYGLEVVDDPDFYADAEIKLGEYEYIRIFFTHDSSSGVESFSIEYTIDGAYMDAAFNTKLFTELIADISAKELDEGFLKEFLSAPESEYSAEDYGFTKYDNMAVYKHHPMNFWEDWNIWFTQYKSNEKNLTYGGYTKFG